jgi:hypothetical protein
MRRPGLESRHAKRQNRGMFRRHRPSAVALWAAVLALLLKAAVPLLAYTAAQLDGLPVAGVCTVYGVALPGQEAAAHAGHAHDHHAGAGGHEGTGGHGEAAHGGDHCALTALTALAAGPALPSLAAPAPPAGVSTPPRARCGPRHDACAAWAARLQHGPPATA